MEPKSKRGRPRKAVPSPYSPATTAFQPLPEGQANAEELQTLSRSYRNYLQKAGISDYETGELAQYLAAIADAIDAGDVFRAGYYALYAMEIRANLKLEEQYDIDQMSDAFISRVLRGFRPEHRKRPWFALAVEGIKKLKADPTRDPTKTRKYTR